MEDNLKCHNSNYAMVPFLTLQSLDKTDFLCLLRKYWLTYGLDSSKKLYKSLNIQFDFGGIIEVKKWISASIIPVNGNINEVISPNVMAI